MFSFLLRVTCIAVLTCQTAAQSPSGTATVCLSAQRGPPSHLASGIINGLPPKKDQIPSKFYTGMGFNYNRGGGTAIPAPGRGWVYGATEFQNRFKSALADYRTTREHNGQFNILTSDLWGADGSSQIAMPGDNDNWTSYDNFLTALIKAINENRMTTGLVLEIWNEPDLDGVFWQRDQNQYLQMWGRGFHRLRAAYPHLPIVGPCASSQPYVDNVWYQNYFQFIKQNASAPDQYAWHLEGDPSNPNDDLETNVHALSTLLSQYDLPSKPILINEYGLPSEQQPAASAWYISRFERYNVHGLRGNWEPAKEVHDLLAGLLSKPGAGTSSYSPITTGYYGNGDYNVYRYYATNMTGQRLATVASADRLFDAYATKGTAANSTKILCGSRLASGTWALSLTGLHSAGLPSNGAITLHIYSFPFTGGIYGKVLHPTDLGTVTLFSHNDALTFPVYADNTTAYAFEVV